MPIDPTLLEELQQSRPFRLPEQEATVALLLTTERLRRFLARTLAERGLTPQQFNVLRILRGSHPNPLPTLEIAARLIEAAPGITALIDRLEGKGLVSRHRCAQDRRRVLVGITPGGLALLEQIDPFLLNHLSAAFSLISPTELEQLVSCLQRLREAIRLALTTEFPSFPLEHRTTTAEKGVPS